MCRIRCIKRVMYRNHMDLMLAVSISYPLTAILSWHQYWGDDADDRIFHAGVSDMHVRLWQDDIMESELACDYLQDGAVSVGNATPEEFQFVTSVVDGILQTEQVVRAGSTTGQTVRAMTPREVAAATQRRARAAELALTMAEDMIQIKDKDGNVLAKKVPPEVVPLADCKNDEDEDVEEVYIMPKEQIKAIVDECDHNKARGNEAFGAGEYGQAILLYSLALDKADELPAARLYARDVLYSNRAACLLKLGQHEKAEQDAQRALAHNPDNIKANFRHGLALHAMGQYMEALPVLAKAHKMEPHNKQVKQALQFCEVRLEQERRKAFES
jgi:tetratricopeptide (TPR) repeat protein